MFLHNSIRIGLKLPANKRFSADGVLFYGTKWALGAINFGPTWVCSSVNCNGMEKLVREKSVVHRERICTFEFIQYIYLCISVLHVNRTRN